MGKNARFVGGVLACMFVLGCAATEPEGSAEAVIEAELITSGEVGLGPVSIAEFPQGFQIHSVGGDTAVLFAVQPSDAPGRARGVHAARRIGGANLPDVAAPFGGWVTPLTIVMEDFSRLPIGGSTGTFLLLDAGVTPASVGMAPAYLYRYSYRFRPSTGLTTTLLESHVLPLNMQPPGSFPDGMVFPGGPTILPGGRVAIPDTFVGSIWVSDENLENWYMALIDPRLGPAPGPSIEGVGLNDSGGVAPYTYAAPPFPGLPPGFGLYPGVHALAYANVTDEVCFPVTGMGGLYCIGENILSDPMTPPFLKSDALRVLVPPTPGLSDLTNGVAYDVFAPESPWFYWQRAPADVVGGGCNALRRINLETGVIQMVACNNSIFSWANEIATLPPLLEGSLVTHVVSSVGQQYNNPEVNFAITSPSYFSPSRIPVTHTLNF
jgi:hypothetical protein